MPAVIPRLPCTISLIRRGGTPMAAARRLCVIPKPLMKSSMRISPGWIGSMRSVSVIVDEFDIFSPSLTPHEAYPPLSVHSNTVLPPTIAGESLQPIARRDAQILQAPSRVKLLELAHGSPLQPTIERPHILDRPGCGGGSTSMDGWGPFPHPR